LSDKSGESGNLKKRKKHGKNKNRNDNNTNDKADPNEIDAQENSDTRALKEEESENKGPDNEHDSVELGHLE